MLYESTQLDGPLLHISGSTQVPAAQNPSLFEHRVFQATNSPFVPQHSPASRPSGLQSLPVSSWQLLQYVQLSDLSSHSPV
jgi:hypothetical protein